MCKAQEHKLTCKAVCQGGTERPGGILAGWVGEGERGRGGTRRSDWQGLKQVYSGVVLLYPYLGRSPECYEVVSPHYQLCCPWGICYWPEVKGKSHHDVSSLSSGRKISPPAWW